MAEVIANQRRRRERLPIDHRRAPLLEGVLKEHDSFVEARVLLASVYYRLNRKEDGDRQKELIQKSNAEQQAKQPQ